MPGFWKRLGFAFRSFYAILVRGGIPADLAQQLRLPAPAPTRAVPEQPLPESCDRAVQMLAILQRDGRLVDFLSENVAPYPDEQLGAAVRNIHESCRQALLRYVTIEPVLDVAEEQPFTVTKGFGTAAVKLIGNVVGEPPIRGVVRHRGWRVREIHLPALPPDSARLIVAPAEVEVP